MKYTSVDLDDELGQMEMPTPCAVCDEIFELQEGLRSPRTPNIVICEDCALEEEKEIEREEEIEGLKEEIEEAEDTIVRAKKRLIELGEEVPA